MGGPSGPPIRLDMSPTTARLALLVLAALLALAPGRAAGAANPSLYVEYAPNCTFAFVGDGGAPVASIAPGTYQLVVATPFAFSNGLASCETILFGIEDWQFVLHLVHLHVLSDRYLQRKASRSAYRKPWRNISRKNPWCGSFRPADKCR